MHRTSARLLAVTAGCLALVAPAARAAVPAASCPGVTATGSVFKTVGPGGVYWLENLGFDGRGGVWVSELLLNRLVRFDAQGNAGATIPLTNPGASLIGPDGLMYAVFGDSPAGALPGMRAAGVVRFDPRVNPPVVRPFAAGLQMGNGAAFDRRGNLYVADTTNPGVARIRPDGSLDPAFRAAAPVMGSDGVVVVGDDLFVTLFTDLASSIARIPLGHPAAFSTFTRLSPPGGAGTFKGLDDATLGPDGKLYVASGDGRVTRVDPVTADACTLYSGVAPVDSVRFAKAFPPFDDASDLFLTSQAGQIIRVHLSTPAVPPPSAPGPNPGRAAVPRIRLTVTPRQARRGRALTLHATVRSTSAACRAGVRIRIGRRAVPTDGRGRASVRVRLTSAGPRTVSARKAGCRGAVARIRVVR